MSSDRRIEPYSNIDISNIAKEAATTALKDFLLIRLYVSVDGNAIANLTAQVNLDDNDSLVMQPPSISMTSDIPAYVAVYGYGTYGIAVYGAGATSNYLVNAIGGGYNISLTISSNDTAASYTVRTAILTYGLEARQ